MTDEVRDRVTGRWAEYGIGAGAAGADSTPARGENEPFRTFWP